MKIGVYGGTFNPPHLGHMAAARTAVDALKLDSFAGPEPRDEEVELAPVLEAGQTTRRVYQPKGCRWTAMEGGAVYEGGQWIDAACPLETMPVFVRAE